MKLFKRLATVGIIGILAAGQCVPAFAATYTYSGNKKTSTTTTEISTTLTGTMTGTQNYLKLTIKGVYSIRGSQPCTTQEYSKGPGSTTSKTISVQTPTYTQIIPGYTNYYAVRCSGKYKTSVDGTYKNVGEQEVSV